MKKTSKKVALRPDGIPALEIYNNVLVDNKSQNDCLVLDKHGQWFRFKSPSHCTIVSAGIEFKWDDFNHWCDNRTIAEIHADHLALFGCEVPKEMVKLSKEDESVHLKLLVWKERCRVANDRTEKPVAVDRKTGEPRGRKLANRKYVLVCADWEKKVTIPQALACMRILASSAENTTNEGCVAEIGEDALKAKITERQSELHTKQDPWRIFQYYRPQLIAAGVLRLV